MLVARFRALTVAPGTTAPDVSWTSPTRLPAAAPWPHKRCGETAPATPRAQHRPRYFHVFEGMFCSSANDNQQRAFDEKYFCSDRKVNHNVAPVRDSGRFFAGLKSGALEL